MKKCPNCSHEANDADAFCLMCGTPIASVLSVNELKTPADTEPKEQAVTDESILSEPEAQVTDIDAAPQPEAQVTDIDAAPQPEVQAIDTPVPPQPMAFEAPPPVSSAAAMQKPEKSSFTFLNTGAGIIIIALIIAAVILMAVQGQYYLLDETLLIQFAFFALISIAAALAVRAKGPDLSIGAIISTVPFYMSLAFIYTGESLPLSIILTIALCAVIGLINGVLIAYLKIPAILLTLLTGVIIRGSQYLPALENTINIQPEMLLRMHLPGLLIITAAIFVFAFLIVLFSRLGTPTYKRDGSKGRLSYMFSYVISAVIAASAGILLLGRNLDLTIVAANPEVYIIFAFALLTASRAFDNRVAPVFISLLPAFIWILMHNLLLPRLFSTYDYYTGQFFIGGGLTLIMLIISYACRYEKKENNYSVGGDISLTQ